jgi:hypothetical protein
LKLPGRTGRLRESLRPPRRRSSRPNSRGQGSIPNPTPFRARQAGAPPPHPPTTTGPPPYDPKDATPQRSRRSRPWTGDRRSSSGRGPTRNTADRVRAGRLRRGAPTPARCRAVRRSAVSCDPRRRLLPPATRHLRLHAPPVAVRVPRPAAPLERAVRFRVSERPGGFPPQTPRTRAVRPRCALCSRGSFAYDTVPR